MITDYEKELISRPWKAFIDSKPRYFTYMELVKAVNSDTISLDTKVTRRSSDIKGTPIGELEEFTPAFYLQLKPKIGPSHTPDSQMRSYFRIEKIKDLFLEFNDKSKKCFELFSFGAGGAGFRSRDKLANIYFKQRNIRLNIPNFTIDGEENFITTGHLLAAQQSEVDYMYFFIFDGIDERRKVLINRNCFFLKNLEMSGSSTIT